MIQDPVPHVGDPREFIDLVRRHRLLIGAMGVLCALFALGYSRLQAEVFESSAVLIFRTTGGDGIVRDGSAGSALTAAAAAQVELRLFESVVVQDAAEERYQGSADVEATILDEAVGLEITARAATPDEAARAANVYADVYSKQRVAARAKDAVAAQGVLRSQIAEVDTELGALQEQINQVAGGVEVPGTSTEQLTTEFTSLTAKKVTLQQRLDALLLVGAGDGPEVVSPAEPSDDPVTPQPVRNTVAGLLGGLVLGVAMMLMRERFDEVVRSEKSLLRELDDLPILAVVPHIDDSQDELLTIKNRQYADLIEPLRTLRSAIQFNAEHGPLRSLAVLSPDPGDGKSTIAFNLALTIGRAGSTVVLVDADVRRPRISRLFPSASGGGLTTVASRKTDLHGSVVHLDGEPNVAVLPAGPKEGWTGLVESQETRWTFECICGLADFLVVDAPPVLPSADALTLSRMVDGVILVIRIGRTRRAAVASALSHLRQVGAPLLGVVVNDAKNSGRNRYRYYEYLAYTVDDESNSEVRRVQGATAAF